MNKIKKYTQEELAFIESTEFALDHGLPISDDDFEKYFELIKDRSKTNV